MRLATFLGITLLWASAASAAEVYIAFDAAGTKRSKKNVRFGQTFDFYVIARGVPDGLLSYRFCVAVPDGISIDSVEHAPPIAYEPAGSCTAPILSSCYQAESETWLLKYRGAFTRYLPQDDMEITVWRPSNPTFPNQAEYLSCDRVEKELTRAPLGNPMYTDGAAVINPTQSITVPNARSSFSRLKALYR